MERDRSIPLRERNVPERMDRDREGGEQSLSKQNIHIYIKPVIFVIRFYSTDRKKTGVVI